MNKDNPRSSEEKVRNALARLKGVEFRGPEELAEHLKKEGLEFSAHDLIAYGHLIATRFGRQSGTTPIPEWLAAVFSKLVEGTATKSICDPWAEVGILIGLLNSASKAQDSIAIARSLEEATLGRVLVPLVDWRVGDPLTLLSEVAEGLDLVASVLPMGLRSSRPLTVTAPSGRSIELRDDVGGQIMVAASMRLSPKGFGFFIVPKMLFFSERSALRQFDELGLGLEAALALPPGTFAPVMNISGYLIVVRRKKIEKLFVAQLTSDQATNEEVIGNFWSTREGASLELGKYVETSTFRGLEAIRSTERFAAAEDSFGVPSASLGELSIKINLGRFGDDFQFYPIENAIFVPIIGKSNVLESVDDLTLKNQNYAQVVINPALSNSRFVAQFLNSEFGRDQREQSQAGTIIPKLNLQTLKEIRVFVPDRVKQNEILDIEAKITVEQSTVIALQNEIAELRRKLWANPNGALEVERQLGNLATRLKGELKEHTSEKLDQWFETLPFPLASILRAWQATPSLDFKTKHEHLLHFFEATAEFLSVIFLSAFSSNEGLFAVHREKLMEAMRNQNLTFQRATFGTWKLVVEYLAKQTRQLLAESGKSEANTEEDRALCADLFADSSLSLPHAISRKEIAEVLSEANKMRNDWSGHGGVVSQREAEHRNQQLIAEVEKLRNAFAGAWNESHLIRGLNCIPRQGAFENEVAIMMGSNSEFLKETRPMSIWLDVDNLYLNKQGMKKALKLLPLVTIGPSPHSAKNACYFFNRMERDGARFISYHYDETPEITGAFADAAETIRFLTDF